jgi:hypothetical protein
VLEEYDVADLNLGLREDLPTVDLYLHLAQPGADYPWNPWSAELVKSLREVQQIYGAVGVQVRVMRAQRLEIPKDWATYEADPMDPPTGPEDSSVDVYTTIERMNVRLTSANADRTQAVVSHAPAERAIHLLNYAGGKIYMRYYEWKGGGPRESIFAVGGLSFPSYVFQDRLPRPIRGLVLLGGLNTKVIAHEMGHMLINVSHEGVGVCPRFEAKGDDLMLYGSASRIPSGIAGRWQRERLLVSPFLYVTKNGEKVFNPDYVEGGRYADPRYGGYMIQPACP